jgi:hypothetical protein
MGLEILAVGGAFALLTFLIVLTALVLSADEKMGEKSEEED